MAIVDEVVQQAIAALGITEEEVAAAREKMEIELGKDDLRPIRQRQLASTTMSSTPLNKQITDSEQVLSKQRQKLLPLIKDILPLLWAAEAQALRVQKLKEEDERGGNAESATTASDIHADYIEFCATQKRLGATHTKYSQLRREENIIFSDLTRWKAEDPLFEDVNNPWPDVLDIYSNRTIRKVDLGEKFNRSEPGPPPEDSQWVDGPRYWRFRSMADFLGRAVAAVSRYSNRPGKSANLPQPTLNEAPGSSDTIDPDGALEHDDKPAIGDAGGGGTDYANPEPSPNEGNSAKPRWKPLSPKYFEIMAKHEERFRREKLANTRSAAPAAVSAAAKTKDAKEPALSQTYLPDVTAPSATTDVPIKTSKPSKSFVSAPMPENIPILNGDELIGIPNWISHDALQFYYKLALRKTIEEDNWQKLTMPHVYYSPSAPDPAADFIARFQQIKAVRKLSDLTSDYLDLLIEKGLVEANNHLIHINTINPIKTVAEDEAYKHDRQAAGFPAPTDRQNSQIY